MSEIMDHKYKKIEQQISSFKKEFSNLLRNYPDDDRKSLLANLVVKVCDATLAHVQLMISEKDERFLISERDYHKSLEGYLAVFNEIKTMPRARLKSIYEIALISDLDTIIKSHCQGEEIE
jgi:hypothetical protein